MRTIITSLYVGLYESWSHAHLVGVILRREKKAKCPQNTPSVTDYSRGSKRLKNTRG